jgi:Holliday junction DNA helicase RuvB
LAEDAASEVARRSRGTPRIANRLLRRIRDFSQVAGNAEITKSAVDSALERLDVDELGFDEMDKRIVFTIIEKFNGGPVGLNTLAVAIGEEGETIEEVYEPYLVQKGFIDRTPRGRTATERAYTHFGLKKPKSRQESLF